MKRRYQPFYCEENVWWLLADLEAERRAARQAEVERVQGEACAIFITNAARAVALWQQRAAPAGAPIVWDYHVIAVAGGQVYDLDSRLGMPLSTGRYLAETFLPTEPRFSPRFRVVPAEEFRTTFATDRRHMRRPDGSYRRPPPSWPPPGAPTHNLMRFVDLSDPISGEILDLEGLRRRLGPGCGRSATPDV